VKWGTREPILVKDPQYHIMIPVLARGQYGVQIENARKFLVKLVGAMPDFDRERLQEYFRGLIITVAKTVVAREIVKKQVSILEISAHLTDLSTAIQESLREALEEFGLKLVNFFVNGIDVQDGDQSIETLRAALAKRAEMSIVGYTYQQERSLNALEGAAGFTAAENGLEGSNNMAAAAMGLGVGFGVGGPLGGALGSQMAQAITPHMNAQPSAPPAPAPVAAGTPCPKCQSPVAAGAKFCPSCGSSTASATPPCVSCGTALAPAAAFCSNCGTGVATKCQGCGAKLLPGAKFCGECGTPTKPGGAA
jgi:membrane protease subunit (stomatin/prohibitin family)